MKKFIISFIISVPFIFSITALGQGPSSAQQILKKFKEKYSQINDFQCIMTKQVTKNEKTFPKASLLWKFKKPLSIYLEFLDLHKGRKIVYVQGKNDNQLVVEMDGILGFMNLKIDPIGERALEEEIAPITHLPFDYLIQNLEIWISRSEKDPTIQTRTKDGIQEGGKTCVLLEIQDTVKGDSIRVFIDLESAFPVKLHYVTQKNEAVVLYREYRINRGFDESDFEL